MRIEDPAIKRSHVAKRIRLRHGYSTLSAKCNRAAQWLILVLCTVFGSALAAYAVVSTGNNNSAAYSVLATISGVVVVVIILGYLARGWRLTLDVGRCECVYSRTYAGLPYGTRRVSLEDGPVGPCTVPVTWNELNTSAASAIGCLLLMLLGPLGLIIGFLMNARRSARPVTAAFPGIFHYDEAADTPTVLLVCEEAKERDRLLGVFAEAMPEYVSLS
jgi:hypothetical protein